MCIPLFKTKIALLEKRPNTDASWEYRRFDSVEMMPIVYGSTNVHPCRKCLLHHHVCHFRIRQTSQCRVSIAFIHRSILFICFSSKSTRSFVFVRRCDERDTHLRCECIDTRQDEQSIQCIECASSTRLCTTTTISTTFRTWKWYLFIRFDIPSRDLNQMFSLFASTQDRCTCREREK